MTTRILDVPVDGSAKIAAISTINEIIRSNEYTNIARVVKRAELIGATCAALAPLGALINGVMDHTAEVHAVVVKSGTDFVDPSLSTPLEHSTQERHRLYALDIMRILLIGAARGCAYAYSDQANGNLCDDVMPLASVQGVKGFSQGSEVGWHTEDAAFNTDAFNCAFDIISMAFYRNKNHDDVHISHPDLDMLDSLTRRFLSESRFPSLTSFAQQGDLNHIEARKSVIYDGNLLRFSFARFEELAKCGLDNQEIEALHELRTRLDMDEVSIDVEPGDIVFVDNMRAAHRRTPWKRLPDFDGSDRWQRRLGFSSQQRFRTFQNALGCGETRVIDNVSLRRVMSAAYAA